MESSHHESDSLPLSSSCSTSQNVSCEKGPKRNVTSVWGRLDTVQTMTEKKRPPVRLCSLLATAADANLKYWQHTVLDFTTNIRGATCRLLSLFGYSQNAILSSWGNFWSGAALYGAEELLTAVQVFCSLSLAHIHMKVSLRAASERRDQWLHQEVRDCRSILTGQWPCIIMDSMATQHQAVAHTLTYSRSSTTNFHHLLQFQGKEWRTGRQEKPREAVTDERLSAAWYWYNWNVLSSTPSGFTKLQTHLIYVHNFTC